MIQIFIINYSCIYTVFIVFHYSEIQAIFKVKKRKGRNISSFISVEHVAKNLIEYCPDDQSCDSAISTDNIKN